MKKEIVINSTTSETRIAILEDGVLAELFVERPETERNVGDIYKGVVRKVLPGMRAAFVDIGWETDSFLHFSDLGAHQEHWFDEENGEEEAHTAPGRVSGLELKPKQEILVQITKEPLGHKGPRVTSQISLPGRFLVLVPNETHLGVSRRVTDFKEKRRLKRLLRDIQVEGYGLIARTAAAGKDRNALAKDLKVLLRLWQKVDRRISAAPVHSCVYKDVSLTSSVLRDLFSTDIDRIVVDSTKLKREISRYLRGVASAHVSRVELYTGGVPIFDYFHVEPEIEKALSRKVWLSGGEYIVIEQTEAVVTIDVNSGRFIGKKDYEANALKVNMRAAREICQQLRLRDMGGIIIIDFIDMFEEKNRKKVYDEMKKELRKSRAKVDIQPISPFGIMEMTRQRIKPSLLYTLNEPCPTCNGSGMVASKETVVTRLERWVKRFRQKTGERGLTIRAHPDIVSYLSSGAKSGIRQIMWRNKMYITLERDETFGIEDFRGFSWKQKREVTDEFMA
jgi:ribonuclease G